MWLLSTGDVSGSVIDRLRRPEYVGENRCIPCTLVNTVLAILIGGVVGSALTVSGLDSDVAAVIGGLTVLVGFTTIYLRGYLVPYTPTLTKRYFPDRVLAWFDKTETQPNDDASELIDVEQTLERMDVLTDCPHRDDLCLDPGFETAWQSRVESLNDQRIDEPTIAGLLDLDDSDRVSLTHYGEAAIVRVDGHQAGQWESSAAVIADIAADQVLRAEYDGWESIDVVNRSRVLNALRMFVERCPSCGARVSVGQEVVESCCRTMDVAAVSCDACGSRIFEIELTDELKAQLRNAPA